MKTLIILSAIPASGKSTWAKEYQKNHDNVVIISSDAIRLEITHGVYGDQSHQKEVWRVFEERMHEYPKMSDNIIVILDALNDTNELRYKYLSTTPEYDKKVLVLFPASNLEKAKYFNSLRPVNARVPDDILVMLTNKFEPPSEEVLALVDELIEVTW